MGNAYVFDKAEIRENAVIKDSAMVHGKAKVSGRALICGNTEVRGNAKVRDHAVVQDFAKVDENAEVFEFACICEFARADGNSKIFGSAKLGGKAKASGNAVIYGDANIWYGQLTKDIKEDLIQYIACSLNVYPVNGKYVLYKRVNKRAPGIYVSLFDPHFVYREGEYAEVENPNLDFLEGCGEGIHVSTPFCWNQGDTLIAVEVSIDDIITCMDGKLRCRKVKVIGEV